MSHRRIEIGSRVRVTDRPSSRVPDILKGLPGTVSSTPRPRSGSMVVDVKFDRRGVRTLHVQDLILE